MKTIFPAILIYLLLGCAAAKKNQASTNYLVIKNIHVVDVLSGKIVMDQDVVVKDQLIYFIGSSFSEKIPSNATIIKGNGKYLSPGLWDMHFHICWHKNNDTLLFPVLLKNGITGVRDMGGDLRILQNFKERLKNGDLAGPVIFGAGPMIDGNPPVYNDFSIPVDDDTNMKSMLDSLRNNGVDFFKTYSLTRENQLRFISTYCSENTNTHFAGHLSEYIDPEISISLGQKSVEHLNRLDDIWVTNKNRLDSIAHQMVTKKTFLCPTLITYQLKTKVRDTSIINREYNKYIPGSLMEEWKTIWAQRLDRHTKKADWKNLDETFISQMSLVNHLTKMGVMILAGSDFAGMPYVYPGIGLHQELNLLVQAGLSNHQALQSATINPAIFMSVQQLYGSITPRKYADMVILEKNPIDDINNLSTINSVIVKGAIYNAPK